jgi:hypothetical protein
MYVDNELTIADKKMVEAFVQQNPDLQDELLMLQQAVLLPDENIVCTNKNLLFKQIGNEITTTNYEEKFLLYIEDELPAKEKAEVETFVLQHPQLQTNFTVLQQTKLSIETIVCPNKEGLYKQEKQRKVIYMQWYKMVAAAVFIGFIALLYFVLPSNKLNPNKSIATLPKNTIAPTNLVAPKKVATPTVAPQKIEQPNTAIAVTTNKTIKSNKNTNRVVSIKNTLNTAIVTNAQPAITKPNGFKQNAIENLHTPLKITQKNDEALVTNSGTNRTTENSIKNDIIDEPIKLPMVTNTKNNTTAQQVVYKELDTNTNEKSLLVGSIEINKDKLRGFLRKASKLFGNKQKTDDNN